MSESTTPFEDNRRKEDKKYLLLREEISIIKSELGSNTVLTNTCTIALRKVNERLDMIESSVNSIADVIQAAEMAFKVLSIIGSAIAWTIKKMSKLAKILIPIGTLLVLASTIIQQFFDKNLSVVLSSWWNSFTDMFK